jgi:hypothetical protein
LGNFVAIQIVANYDTRIMHPFLLQAHHHLNPNRAPTKLLSIKDDDLFFGHIVSHVDEIL